MCRVIRHESMIQIPVQKNPTKRKMKKYFFNDFLSAVCRSESTLNYRFHHSCIKLTHSTKVVWEARLLYSLKDYNDQLCSMYNRTLLWGSKEPITLANFAANTAWRERERERAYFAIILFSQIWKILIFIRPYLQTRILLYCKRWMVCHQVG